MKPLILLLLCLPTLLCAQEFQFRQEFDTIPVEIDGWHPFAPWTGGDSETAPAFCDIDADGDYDCFVGNMGYRLTFYENIGAADSAIFKYRTRYYSSIQIDSVFYGRLDPCFVDIDADEDFDLFSGDGNGWVHYWKNFGTTQQAQFVKITDSLFNVQYSNPASVTLYDIDGDLDYDLFIGDNYWGYIHFYRNIGTPQSFNFVLESDQFQNIDVGQRASPSFTDSDGDGDGDLFIGNSLGRIWYYRNDTVGGNLIFSLISNNYEGIDVGENASPTFADLNGDDDQDMALGLKTSSSTPHYGDVAFYENNGTPYVAAWDLLSNNFLTWNMGGHVTSQGTDIDADGLHDIFVELLYCTPDYLAFYKNVGTSQIPSFSRITDNYQNIHIYMDGFPFFSDINADRKIDLFIGQGIIPNPPYPGLYYYQNIGTPRDANFSLVTNNLIPWNFDACIRPALVDIDDDGDKDLFILDNNMTFFFVQNIGTTTQPVFANPIPNWQNIHPYGLGGFNFSDVDEDGDYDLFINSVYYNSLDFYCNVGTAQNPNFQFVTHGFLGTGIELIEGSNVDIIDIDNDGDDDYIISSYRGGMTFFRNITGDSTAVPIPPKQRPWPSRATLTIGPNPSNPITAISYQLSAVSLVNLSVYDISGRRVAQLVNGKQNPGEYSVSWNATSNASGVYLVRLTTPEEEIAQKVVIIK